MSKVKEFQRAFARNIFYCARAVIRVMPYWLYRIVSVLFLWLGYLVMLKRRKIMKKNIDLAYGDSISFEEKKRIINKCYHNVGQGMIDLIYFIDRPEEVKRRVQFEGWENLEKALEGGKGVIFLSAHFGIFILLYIRMALAGHEANVIMRPVRDDQLEQYITKFRKDNGINTIYALPPMRCVSQCLKALRGNGVLFILLDQHYGSEGGVKVDFFGQPAATATGPIVFHNRTGAPVLPIFIRREGKGNHHTIVIEPPVDIKQYEDPEEMTLKNVQTMSDIIERWVRTYPHEWSGWLHKRWK